MLRYELIFGVSCEGEETSAYVKRIILAQNYVVAKEIGEAMIGEPVNCSEELCVLRSVAQTFEDPVIGSWHKELLWQIVPLHMKLREPQYEYIYHGGEIVGLFLYRYCQ